MEIQRGKVKKPFIIMAHGTQGVGKSTFASSLPEPIFIGTENTDEIDTARAPKANSISELNNQLDFLIKDKSFETIVVDAIDGVEQLAIQEIINSDPKCKNPSLNRVHGGYGAGFDMLVKSMLDFRDRLQVAREAGKNICIICHTKTKTTVDPVAGATYDEFKLALNDKTENIWLDWVSATLFMTDLVEKQDDEQFAFGRGEKIIYTQRRPGAVAKNRFNLPYELEMPVDNPSGPFLKYYDRFFNGDERSAGEILKNIASLCENLTDENLKQKINESIEKSKGNVKKLEQIENRVIERLG